MRKPLSIVRSFQHMFDGRIPTESGNKPDLCIDLPQGESDQLEVR